MKILVTGANGQLGFCLTRALTAEAFDFLSLTRDQLDIGDAGAVKKVVSEYAPDLVINAAAYTAVDKAEVETDIAYRINCQGAANLAAAANDIGAAIFHVSTDYVFAGDGQAAYKESAPTAPQCVYGKSKLDGELAVAAANSKHIILRTAWVFCEHGNNFVKTMVRLGRDRDQLGVVADQFGGPTYAGDIADALLKMAEQYQSEQNLPWGIYHYSGYPHASWFEFATHIFNAAAGAAIYSKSVPVLKAITTADYPTPAKRPANSRLDCSAIQQSFGVLPSDWRAALKNIQAYS